MPRRASSGVGVRVMSCWSNRTLPAEARHRPMIVRREVVLPAPLRPRSMVSEFGATLKATPCRMWYWPMCVLTPLSCSRSGTSDSEIGFLHDRRRNDFGGRALGDELALVQHDDAVGERAHHVHLVLDEQHGLVALRLDVADQVEDHRHLVDAHAGGRLVEHEHLGLEREQDRHLELALVAVRKGGGDHVALRGERDALEVVLCLVDEFDVRVPHGEQALAGIGSRLYGEAHVLEHRKARKEIGELEGAADAALRAARRPHARDVFAEEQHLAAGRGELAGDQVEVGGLAGAVRPDDRGERAGPELAGHRIDGDMAAEADRQAARLQYGLYFFTRTGTFISSGLISRTSCGTAHATFGSTLILKWYIDCIAWWSSLRKVMRPFGVSKERPSIAPISFSVSVLAAFFSASTTAMPAAMPPAVKKSGGDLKRFWCSATSQSFTLFF